MEYKKSKPVSLKAHPVYTEKWLQERIAEDTTLLCLLTWNRGLVTARYQDQFSDAGASPWRNRLHTSTPLEP